METEFLQAVADSKTITTRPSNEQLLRMYALYKQATEGDVQGTRPGMFDFKGQAKYDAWAKEAGKTKDDAMQQYIALVASLK
ncbi:MAG: acyl-CoA-binding protein [Bacteroidetes bacterium]|nr:MAG: acyl-CoA-binding protein [Bacteroidota bacterium]